MNRLYLLLFFFVLSFSCTTGGSDDNNNVENDLDRMASELEQLAEKNPSDEEGSRRKVIKKLGSIKKLIGKVELNHGATKKLGKVIKEVFGDEEVMESIKRPQNEENIKQTIDLIKKKLDDQPELKEEVKSVFKQKSEGNKFLDKLGKFGKFIARAGKWIFKIIKKLFKISVFMTKFLINLVIRLVGEVIGIALFLPALVLFLYTAGSMIGGKALYYTGELIGHSLDVDEGPFSEEGYLHFLQFDLGTDS